MKRMPSNRSPNALLAFGRRVSAGEAFDDLVAERGWRLETWTPTFIDEPSSLGCLEPTSAGSSDWGDKQLLRRADLGAQRPPDTAADVEPRLMIASADDLPSLYFVEWHYIDFVLSCVGNVSEAARILGIRRSTVQRKRKKTPPHR
jgi:hypothetical protein